MKIRIGIIGAGSLGTLIGGYLAMINSDKYDIEISLFCREAHSIAIRRNGLILENESGQFEITNIQSYSSGDSFNIISFDYLFLTTKAYDISNALIEYKELADKCRWLVIFQNGIGNEELVQEYCPAHKIIRGVTTNGALLKEPGYIIHTGKGFTRIGFPFIKLSDSESESNMQKEGVREALEILNDLLNLAGFNCSISDDIIRDCWEKIFVNVGINPFGALTRLKNGDLLKNNAIKNLMAEAVKEGLKVAEGLGINLPDKDFVALTYDVATKAAENKNSMLQDILKQKRTEIDFINGKIVHYAKKLGIRVPINELLTALIKGLESSFDYD
ncbi:MAG: ketopantoate reductase family protein [Promethearchaeia archaeon]